MNSVPDGHALIAQTGQAQTIQGAVATSLLQALRCRTLQHNAAQLEHLQIGWPELHKVVMPVLRQLPQASIP